MKLVDRYIKNYIDLNKIRTKMIAEVAKEKCKKDFADPDCSPTIETNWYDKWGDGRVLPANVPVWVSYIPEAVRAVDEIQASAVKL